MKRDDGTHALSNQRYVADSSLAKMMPRPIATSPQRRGNGTLKMFPLLSSKKENAQPEWTGRP